MFIITKRFTRAKAVVSVLLLGVFLSGIILLTGACQRNEEVLPPMGETNEERLAYLAERGWEVDAEPIETLHLQLPEEFQDTEYDAYNALQLSQGFDLREYVGMSVVRYTYAVKNHPERSDAVQLNLYCCDGVIIAGDVMALGGNGFQSSLVFPAAE